MNAARISAESPAARGSRRAFALFAAASVIAFAGCSKCGSGNPTGAGNNETAGTETDGSWTPPPGYVSVDLRSAIITAVPEWRGMRDLFAVAVLEETLLDDPSDGGDLAAALAPEFPSRRFVAASSDAGALIAQNKPFFAEAERIDGKPVVRVGIVVPGEQFAGVMQTPAPITTEQLRTLIPVNRNTRFTKENFIFEAHYKTSLANGATLLQQLTDSLLKSGWTVGQAPNALFTPDAGTLPPEFKAELRDPTRKGTMTIGRSGEQVTVVWQQPIVQATLRK
ncbi:MAG: hypothetical protein ACJ790_17365 [Myxococcaceae bacterium]